AQRLENRRYRFSRENIPGEKHARQNRQKRQLHRFRLRIRLARNQNAQRQRREKVRQRQNPQQQHTAVNRHLEYKAHEEQNQAQLKEPDSQIGQQLTQQQPEGP